MFGDHLGSTSKTYKVSNGETKMQLYTPWGERRYPTAASEISSRYRYTGQYEYSELGLYFYQSRWYDASLGRFAQADTIVPNPGDSQSWDRYAYVRNNPLRYIDPSGHADVGCVAVRGASACQEQSGYEPLPPEEDEPRVEETTVAETPLIVYLVCGVGILGECKNQTAAKGYNEGRGDEPPLNPYYTYWINRGIIPTVVEFNDYGGNGTNKYDMANAIIADMASHPGHEYILIGHSAGADAVILAVDMAGYTSDIQLIVLLDPTLTASFPGKSTPVPGNLNLLEIAIKIHLYGIPIFLGDSPEDGYVFITGANRIPYDDLRHLNLAVADRVLIDIIDFMNWP